MEKEKSRGFFNLLFLSIDYSPLTIDQLPSTKNQIKDMHIFLKTVRKCLIILAFLSATLVAHGYVINTEYEKTDIPEVKLHGRTYVILPEACKALGIEWRWDSIARIATLEGNGHILALLAGSKYYSIDGKIKKLKSAVLMENGYVYAPLYFVKYKLEAALDMDKERDSRLPAAYSEASKSRASRADASQTKHIIHKIVIDPGHGGKDPGAIGCTGLYEKDVVLDVSKMVKDDLKRRGFDVIMTRQKDVFVALRKRSQIANENNADLFVSIHANANRKNWVRGFEVYYLSEAYDDNAKALAASENSAIKYEDESFGFHTQYLDAIVWDLTFTENRTESIELANYICRNVDERAKPKSSKVRCARFYVLKGTRMPAVLVELSYLSNKWEERSLKDQDYRKKLSRGIADGIEDYRHEYEKTNGFSN